MLTRLKIENFKRLENMDVELGETVVLIGPNNSGKTTALQALALWEIGLKKWLERRSGKSSPEKRPGVTINRRDLISIPVPNALLLWRGLHVRDIQRTKDKKMSTQNVFIDILVEGITNGVQWSCGLEFYYANEESLYCRPLRLENGERMAVPSEALLNQLKVAFLPPMSGLAATEPKWETGRINVLLGEGQTAQVLRNLCYKIYEENQNKEENQNNWERLKKEIKSLFGIDLLPPEYLIERGEITMSYREPSNLELDLSSAGRGLQQTLLLLAYLLANPRSILLLDEPDAHLEVLRQRQIYQLLVQVARQQQSQIIAASHSEVVLNEAAERDTVVAFLGRTPKKINNPSDRGSQIQKSLKEIGFEQYYFAEQTGWVLYLEGSTDLLVLQQLAKKLNYQEAQTCLENPFVYYVANQPIEVSKHFEALRYAKPDLVGVALFDKLEKPLPESRVPILMWQRREIENYFCTEQVLLAYARHDLPYDLFGLAEANRREQAMQKAIAETSQYLSRFRRGTTPWAAETKVTDDFLDPLFEEYFEQLGINNVFRKTSYYELVQFIEPEAIDPEVRQKLEKIVEVAGQARPMS